MVTFLQKYRNVLRREHGWDIELTCPGCRRTEIPQYDGWKPSRAINFGNTPTIYAKVTCIECGQDLRTVAGEQLVDVFSQVATPKANKRAILSFVIAILVLTLVPLVIDYVLGRGFRFGIVTFVLLGPMILFFNYRIASMRMRCSCGTPKYVFMGLLGRTSCYRCSNCGNLLRLRD